MNLTHTPNKVQRRCSGEVAPGTFLAKVQAKLDYGFTKYGEVPIIGLLIGIAIGILSLIIIFSVVPLIAGTVENALPEVEGQWDVNNESNNIPTGHELWTTIGPLIIVAALIAVVAVILKLIGAF